MQASIFDSSPTKPAPWREIYWQLVFTYIVIYIARFSIPVKYQWFKTYVTYGSQINNVSIY